jgi:hypothetical protein
MQVGAANSSVHVGPLERTTPTSVALLCSSEHVHSCLLPSSITSAVAAAATESSKYDEQRFTKQRRKQGPHAPPDLSTCLRQ